MHRPTATLELPLVTAADLLAGGGEMGALMRSIDWSKTAVGPVESWPQSLCTALSILLETGFPMYIAWGPEFTQFYNDGYRPILGSTKHPAAMGISTRQTFAEIWDIIGPMFGGVMEGTPVTVTDFMLPLDRHGFVEECYFVFSYSPIRAETRQVGGVLVTVTETTERVLAARRLVTLQDLAARGQKTASAEEACGMAAGVLAESAKDVPFALLYLIDAAGTTATLAGSAHLAPGTELCPTTIALTDPDGPWPLASVAAAITSRIAPCPAVAEVGGPEGTAAPREVLALPIVTPGAEKASGILIAALSPRLVFDSKYRSFLELVAGHVGSAIASARALAEATARAAALAEIDRAKTAFFSNVSHEFRTPLTLMLGPAEDALASGSSLSVEERERWLIVHRSALRLSKLVNTLLDFSRIEAGRVEASFESTDLGAVTRELASMFRSATDRVGIGLRLELPDVGEPAFVDRDMWEKIILNLLSNALKFTFEGEITVSLAIVGADFELAVADTGIGIAASDLPQVFDRFHRVKGARARTQEGTGIGLAFVAELVKLHGGTVSAESVEGGGTTFRVRIPRGRSHLPSARLSASRRLPSTALGAAPFVEEALRWSPDTPGASATQVDAAPLATPSDHPRERIVLADDNADMRDYLCRLLRERWDVEAFADGESALAAIRSRAPDLVLSDVMMPGLDGFGLLRALRGDSALRLTPVVLLSARAGEEAKAEGLAAGANDYMVKPFSARDLLVRVASTLTAARGAREMHAREQEQRANLYRHFMQAPFPIAVFRGPRHIVELANPETLTTWGKQEDVVGLPLEDAVPELRGQPFLGWLDDVFRTGIAFEGKEQLARLPNGPRGEVEEVFCNFVYAPLRDARGEIEGVLLSAFLVTDQVRARRELESALRRAEDAERAQRTLLEFQERFVAVLGHDLRNPLGAIEMGVGLLRQRAAQMGDDATLRVATRIGSSTTRASRMVAQILDLSRTRIGGGLTVQPVPADLRVMLTVVVDELRATNPTRAIVLDSPSLPGHWDRDRLEQVFSNLIGNAVHHGAPDEAVTVTAREHGHDDVSVIVHNLGTPIPERERESLFDPFRRGERDSRAAKTEGLGLGLFISRELVTAHGGRIEVQSSADEGTTFRVTLPRTTMTKEAPPRPASDDAHVEDAHGAGGGGRGGAPGVDARCPRAERV